jgi:hypothetical protein
MLLPQQRRQASRCLLFGDKHIAIAEALDGKVVDWMEHVSDAQYRA